ncbi:hypothetical protein ACE1SV_38810 [Streptomyces sennicomposti]
MLPDRTPGESLLVPLAVESAKAEVPDRDRMPVAAAAAANTPLLRVCRNVVSSCVKNGESRPWNRETEFS